MGLNFTPCFRNELATWRPEFLKATVAQKFLRLHAGLEQEPPLVAPVVGRRELERLVALDTRREVVGQGGSGIPELRLMGGGLRAVDRENSPYRNFPCRCSVPKIFSAGRFLNFRNELTARRDFSSDFRNELTAPPDAISKTRFSTL